MRTRYAQYLVLSLIASITCAVWVFRSLGASLKFSSHCVCFPQPTATSNPGGGLVDREELDDLKAAVRLLRRQLEESERARVRMTGCSVLNVPSISHGCIYALDT